MTQITLQFEKLTCPSCMQKITDTISALTGIAKIKILFNLSKARIIYNEAGITEKEILHKINEIGYEAVKI